MSNDPGALGLVSGTGLAIGIVQSRFNPEVVERMARACRDELATLGVAPDAITLVTVPGALEIPLALQVLAQSNRCHALIALGAVVRGDTYHFEIVANESARGIMDVSLQTGQPIANAILTTNDEPQALARAESKARDAARVAVEMAMLLIAMRYPR